MQNLGSKSKRISELWVIERWAHNLLIFSSGNLTFSNAYSLIHRFQWPRGLRRRSVAPRLLRLWVGIPPEALMFFCYECCVLSGRGLCDELITLQKQDVATGFVNCFWVTEKNVGLGRNFTLPVAQVSYETPHCIYLKLLFQYSALQGC